ncbi:MAG: Re/Si-specific NAD(P)(+) transhydrogenase subunit alpha [Nitriliruptoraceae bacterium]
MPTIFIPKERAEGERRVAASPVSVAKLTKLGVEVVIEAGAGAPAHLPDEAFREAGARIAEADAVATAQLVARVAPPTPDEVAALAPGTVLLSFVAPHRNLAVVRALADRQVTTLAMELVPRISRAQAIDALSSQANVAGYRAVVTAAYELDKFLPLFMTAAGTIKPATLVVLGAGVAGLQAVATGRRLGAVVKVSDIREAAKQEVASLGGTFIDVPSDEDLTGEGGYAKEAGEDFLSRQRRILTEHLSGAHAAITTAQIPGRAAPLLLTAEMVEAMPPGAVVIDLAAADGGNCELTELDRVVEHHGVRIIPGHDLAGSMPGEASRMYGNNIAAFVQLLVTDGELHLDLDDEVVQGALLTHDGEVVHERTAELLAGEPR